jgi:cell division protein FtsB
MLRAVPRLRSRRPRVPFVMLVSLVLVAGVVGLLLFNTSMQQASFDSTRLEEQAAALSAREEGLQMELERLRDPQRLAALARRHGMVPARSAAFLDLETGEVSGPKPTPATGAESLDVAPPKRRKPKVLTPTPIQVPAQQPASIGGAAVQGPTAPDAGATGAPRGNRGAGAHSGGTGR